MHWAATMVCSPALDVTEPAQIERAVRAAVERFGRIDVVVNNAGRALLGVLEEMGDKQIRDQFDLNVFATIDVIRAVLPTLRAQRSGTIVNVSSAGGVVGFPASSMYNATKFAVEGLTAGLRHDLARWASRYWPSNRARSAPTSWNPTRCGRPRMTVRSPTTTAARRARPWPGSGR